MKKPKRLWPNSINRQAGESSIEAVANQTSPAVLITASLPDPEKWEAEFKRKRK